VKVVEGVRAGSELTFVNRRFTHAAVWARARLAELEAGFTIEKAQVEALKARLFARLRRRWMASGALTARPYSRGLLRFLGRHFARGSEPGLFAIR